MAREFRVEGVWDSREVQAAISSLDARHRRFAMSYAINLTAKKIKSNEVEVMPTRLDRPTPFTLRSLFMQAGNKEKPDARVFFKDRDFGAQKGTPAGVYLMPQVGGGGRNAKGFERGMMRRGFIHQGQFLIPASGIQFDQYGNVPKSMITKIMSGLGVFGEVGFAANATRSRRSRKKGNAERFFFGNVDGHLGIWERVAGGHVKPLFTVQGEPHYRSRFPFFQVGENTADAHFLKNLEFAMERTIATSNFKGKWGG